jgi:hypothetical protein
VREGRGVKCDLARARLLPPVKPRPSLRVLLLAFLGATAAFAQAPAGRAAWMREAHWGVMTHFLADWRARVDGEPASVDQMTALHKRVALLAMTNHEFLDPNYKKERTTFADGTTVTVNWDAKTATIGPDVN